MLPRFDRQFTMNMSTPVNATSMQNLDTSIGSLSLVDTTTVDISKIEALDYKCASTSTSQASTNSTSPLKTSSPSSSNMSSDSTSKAAALTYPYATIVRQDDEDNPPLIRNRTRVVKDKKIHGQALFEEHTRFILGDIERPRTRLLILEPGSGQDPIRCSLDQYRLDKAPQFEALSYAWGDGPKDREVHASDKILLVSQNLHTALSHLRYSDQTRVLWPMQYASTNRIRTKRLSSAAHGSNIRNRDKCYSLVGSGGFKGLPGVRTRTSYRESS
jgi:hypothetical protein